MKQFTFNYKNVEVIVQLEEILVEESKDNFQNYISSIKYKTLIKNTIETIEPKYEGDPETSLVYWALGYDDLETSPPDLDSYLDITDINLEIFYSQIEEKIISDKNKTYYIELYGSILGLCEKPTPIENPKKPFVKQTFSDIQNSDISFTDAGLAKLYL